MDINAPSGPAAKGCSGCLIISILVIVFGIGVLVIGGYIILSKDKKPDDPTPQVELVDLPDPRPDPALPDPQLTPIKRIKGYTVSGAGERVVNGFYREHRKDATGLWVYLNDSNEFEIRFYVQRTMSRQSWEIGTVGIAYRESPKSYYLADPYTDSMTPPGILPRASWDGVKKPGPLLDPVYTHNSK